MVRVLSILTMLLLVGGCAAPSLYEWGGYEQALYDGYKDPNKMTALRVKLEKYISEMESSDQKVAPGLYAELGTLYLQSGDTEKAISMYSRERNAWGESRALMTTMIENIERRQQGQGGEQ